MKLAVLILEDEPEVRLALERDLISLTPLVRLEPAEDVEDAWEAIHEIKDDGDLLALALCDHRLPGTTGVDFMVELAHDHKLPFVRKVLVTGQADLSDTIRALNDAHLDHYVAKPWDPEDLITVVKSQLTDYVINRGMNPMPFLEVLDMPRALEAVREFGPPD